MSDAVNPEPSGADAQPEAPRQEAVTAPAVPASPEAPEAATPAPSAPRLELPAVEEQPLVHKHFTAPALIPLERVDDDHAFLVRSEAELADVSGLATELARLGQLFPIDVRLRPPDRFQVITGFRRVAALRFLQREKVLARLHADLSDADALLMALASAIHSRAVATERLGELKGRLEAEGRLSPAARDMLEKALAADSSLAPEEVEEEVDADELAADVTVRLGQCNQDLALLADVFGDLEPARQEELLTQLRYSVDLVAFLEGKR
jgi:hypothetical protein